MSETDKDVIKCAFFFGAGAEGKGNYGLPSGLEFLDKTLFKKNDKLLEVLKEFFSGKYYRTKDKCCYEYSKYSIQAEKKVLKKAIYAKAMQDEEFFLKHFNLLFLLEQTDREDLSKKYSGLPNDTSIYNIKENQDVISAIKKHTNSKSNWTAQLINTEYKDTVIKQQTDVFKKIANEFEEICRDSDRESPIENPVLKDMINESKHSISFNFEFNGYGIFEDLFPTIIDPIKFGKTRFSKIFNYYWTSYFVIVEGIVNYYDDANFNSEYKEDGSLKYKKILRNFIDFTNALYKLEKSNEETYYSKIFEYVKQLEGQTKIELSGVLTTNYYNFFEKSSSEDSQIEVAYLNGKLNLLEYPELLSVVEVNFVDAKKENTLEKDKLFFPFIFGQSLLKPIVSKYQIEEFNKLIDILDKTDVLIILGYNLNEDDNHINSFLRDFVVDGNKRIIVVSDKENVEPIKQRLKLPNGNVEMSRVDYGAGNGVVIESVFKQVIGV